MRPKLSQVARYRLNLSVIRYKEGFKLEQKNGMLRANRLRQQVPGHGGELVTDFETQQI